MIHLGSTKPVPSSKEKERILRTCSRPLRAVLSSPVDHQPRWKPRRQTTRPCRDCVLPFSVCDERAWRCNRTTCIRPGKRTGYLRIHRENRMVVLPPHSGQCPQSAAKRLASGCSSSPPRRSRFCRRKISRSSCSSVLDGSAGVCVSLIW